METHRLDSLQQDRRLGYEMTTIERKKTRPFRQTLMSRSLEVISTSLPIRLGHSIHKYHESSNESSNGKKHEIIMLASTRHIWAQRLSEAGLLCLGAELAMIKHTHEHA